MPTYVKTAVEKRIGADRISVTFDAAKNIALLLDPLSNRAKRRIMVYFEDLVNDNDSLRDEALIINQVKSILGMEGVE